MLKEEIKRLDNELREMQKGENYIVPLIKDLPLADQQEIKDEIAKEEEERLQTSKALEEYLPTLEIKWELPAEKQTHLRNLNTAVRESAMNLERFTLRRRLWKSYTRCKAFIPTFLHFIPHETWRLLSEAQALAATREDPHWAERMLVLVDDMREAGVELVPYQIMLRIEALRSLKRFQDAISEWRDLRVIVKDDEKASAEYELLGVRLFTSQGDLSKAEQIATTHLESEDRPESRILIPILDTWADRKDDVGMKHAWALYLRLRIQLGSDITMKDYDTVGLIFLHRGRTDLALAVFKDMMLTGQENGETSTEIYRRSQGRIDEMQRSATNMPEVNKISLASMMFMPKRFQNKFFYASWMKKLIGMGEVDSAASVVELMYERGVRPDAKHLNGIIGAWFRSNSDEQKARAEEVAWLLIQQRLRRVRSRSHGATDRTYGSSVDSNSAEPAIPPYQERCIPSATIETYCLLLHFYTYRDKHDQIDRLYAALEQGEMQPNIYWVNHLLEGSLRKRRYDLVWKGYLGISEAIIEPDLITYDCLWESMESSLKRSVLRPQRFLRFPNPRRIMHEFSGWLQSRSGKQKRGIREDFKKKQYNRVVRCLLGTDDLAGTIVALYVMRDLLGRFPSESTNQAVIEHLSRLTLRHVRPTSADSPHHRTRLSANTRTQVETIFKLAQRERAQVLANEGFDDLEFLDERRQNEESLFLLAEILRTFMWRLSPDGPAIEARVQQAKEDIGASDVNMEDPVHRKW